MKKIVMVEDDLDLYNLYKTQLELSGYSVTNVPTGDKAVGVVTEQLPDLVLLDLLLPGKNGLEILEELKSQDATKDIKVVMITNFGSDDNVSKALELGAEDYIMKYNVVPDEISTKIAGILGDASESAVKIVS